MQRRFRRAFNCVKEHSSVNLAKIATVGGLCNLDMVVLKATAPDDLPLSEKYVQELLQIFSISPSSFRDFSLSFTRRFGKTRCWRVALKCLILLHRLLRSVPENSPFRSAILWSRSNRLLSLYPCHFRDISSSSTAYDFTIFVHCYARLLDEALDCVSPESNINGDESFESFSDKMNEVGRVLEFLPMLQSLMDRVMDCRPTRLVARSFLVRLAMKQMVRDSFVCYASFRKDIIIVLDNLLQMQHRSSISALSIYKRASLQASQLSEFYDWCKSMRLCGPNEYPLIDKIPQIQVKALENFLDGMWQLTDSSSSVTSPASSTGESPLNSTADEGEGQYVQDSLMISWESLVEKEEREPLIQFDELDNNVSWETLLEASVNSSDEYQENEIAEGWALQLYNPNALNPFY